MYSLHAAIFPCCICHSAQLCRSCVCMPGRMKQISSGQRGSVHSGAPSVMSRTCIAARPALLRPGRPSQNACTFPSARNCSVQQTRAGTRSSTTDVQRQLAARSLQAAPLAQLATSAPPASAAASARCGCCCFVGCCCCARPSASPSWPCCLAHQLRSKRLLSPTLRRRWQHHTGL